MNGVIEIKHQNRINIAVLSQQFEKFRLTLICSTETQLQFPKLNIPMTNWSDLANLTFFLFQHSQK